MREGKKWENVKGVCRVLRPLLLEAEKRLRIGQGRVCQKISLDHTVLKQKGPKQLNL